MKLSDYFKQSMDTGHSDTVQELEEALASLVKKGIMTETIIDGEIHYSLTDYGKVVGEHIIADPKDRN